MKITKQNFNNEARVYFQAELQQFENYLHFYGNDEEVVFEFSSEENKEEIEAVLNQDIASLIEKNDAIENLYREMVEDIYSEMKTVFGTSNDVSVAAFVATYEAMISRPENYIDESLGLASVADVEAYATAKLAASDAYGVFRLKRIAKFETDKAAL